MRKSIKVYIVGNEIDGFTVKCRMNTKLLFESHYDTRIEAERFIGQLEGVTIYKTHSLTN
jgi:hypothetical protein